MEQNFRYFKFFYGGNAATYFCLFRFFGCLAENQTQDALQTSSRGASSGLRRHPTVPTLKVTLLNVKIFWETVKVHDILNCNEFGVALKERSLNIHFVEGLP